MEVVRISRRRRGQPSAGRPMVCICPSCGHKGPKTLGVPCRGMRCPKCGSIMVRSEGVARVQYGDSASVAF